jgi:hypothetical protein
VGEVTRDAGRKMISRFGQSFTGEF